MKLVAAMDSCIGYATEVLRSARGFRARHLPSSSASLGHLDSREDSESSDFLLTSSSSGSGTVINRVHSAPVKLRASTGIALLMKTLRWAEESECFDYPIYDFQNKKVILFLAVCALAIVKKNSIPFLFRQPCDIFGRSTTLRCT
jgi:hypothetical protein